MTLNEGKEGVQIGPIVQKKNLTNIRLHGFRSEYLLINTKNN